MAVIAGAPAGAAALPARPAAIEHVIDFQDALTGEPLPAGDVATLALDASSGGGALATTAAETSPDGTALRRVWAMPARGDASFPVGGADARRSRRPGYDCSRRATHPSASSRTRPKATVGRAT